MTDLTDEEQRESRVELAERLEREADCETRPNPEWWNGQLRTLLRQAASALRQAPEPEARVLEAARRMKYALHDDPAIGSEMLARDIEVVVGYVLEQGARVREPDKPAPDPAYPDPLIELVEKLEALAEAREHEAAMLLTDSIANDTEREAVGIREAAKLARDYASRTPQARVHEAAAKVVKVFERQDAPNRETAAALDALARVLATTGEGEGE